MSERLRERLHTLPPASLPEPADRLERVLARARSRRRVQLAAAGLSGAAVVAGLALAATLLPGGGGVPQRVAVGSSPTPGRTSSSPPLASTLPSATPTPAGPQPCAGGALQVSLGQEQGAAGTFYQPLVFRNQGTVPCTLTGYPGVSFLDPVGAQVGSPARREAPGGVTPPTVTLAVGAAADATLALQDTGNFPPASCQPASATQVRIYPPGGTVATVLPLNAQICTVSANGPYVLAVTGPAS